MNLKLLKKFCSKDEGREALFNPLSQGEWTFATNGIIAVRVPRLDAVGEAEFAPDCVKMFKKHWRKTQKHVWIDPPEPVATAWDFVDIQGPLGHVRVDLRYVRLCRMLPGCKIALTGEESLQLTKPVLLKFDGGDGLLMPMRR